MNMFSSKGPVGVGVAYGAFSVLNSLLRHLEASGTLIPSDINAILAEAFRQIPDDTNPARADARRLIESLKR